jgi:phospholipid/cholesterol/gamma-HCH transport system substrate-binding protein
MEIPYRERFITGLIAIIVFLGLTTFVIQYSNGALAHGYKVQAVFTRAGQGLVTGNDVKIRGVTVGTVKSIKLASSGSNVVVTMFLKPGTKVADTATVTVDPLSVFGPKYLNIVQGADESIPGSALRAGDVIPVDRTTPATELLDVINTAFPLLRAIDPQELQTVVESISRGLSGLGPEFAQVIDNAKVILDHATAQVPNLNALLPNAAQLSNVLAQRGGELLSLAQNLNQILPIIGSPPDRVAPILDGAAQLSNELATLVANTRPAVDQIVSGLTSVVDALYPVRAGLPTLVDTLDNFFGLVGGIIRDPIGTPGGVKYPHNIQPGNIKVFFPCQLGSLLTTSPPLPPAIGSVSAC